MFSFWYRDFMDLAANLGSRSDITLSGVPYLENTLSIKISAMSSADAVFFVAVSIIPFVSPWSTMDNIESKPSSGGRSVIRSIDIWLKGRVEVGPLIGCIGGLIGCRLILYCWHMG